MQRAILIALGTGVVISSAMAALEISGFHQPPALGGPDDPVVVARARASAREEQRERIHARYAADRAACGELRGFQREKCLVRAHARKGRALLEEAAPYRTGFQSP